MTPSEEPPTLTEGREDDEIGSTRRHASTRSPLIRMLRHATGGPAILYLVCIITAVIFAPSLAPYGPNNEDLTNFLSGPSHLHWLGTDELGRDIVSRILYGGRISLSGVGETVVVALVLGLILGTISGFRGGFLDSVLSRVTEVAMSVPAIVVLLMVFAVTDNSNTWSMLTLGVLTAPTIFRVARASTLVIRSDDYISAARVSGVGDLTIIRRHIVPRIMGPVCVNVSVLAGVALGIQTGLNYLGLGVNPPAPSWGGLVADAQGYLEQQPWLIVPSGLVVALTILSFVLIGDALRDVLGLHSSSVRVVGSEGVTQTQLPETDDRLASNHEGATLSVRGLSVIYGAKVTAKIRVIQDIAFDLSPGEIVGVVGESGSGKTVTALAILGLLGPGGEILHGQCIFEGQDLVQMSDAERRRVRGSGIAYVSQEPMTALDQCYTIFSQLRELVRLHEPSLGRNEVSERVSELLDQVGLPNADEVGRKYPHQISGGMAQRVCIAAALAGRPRLLVADEPTTALDVTIQAEILDLLRTIRDETGMAVLLITHDLGVVADLCDRAVVMYAGEVVELGSVQQVMSFPLHPYTKALIAANPTFAVRGEELQTIPGAIISPLEWPVGCHFANRCSYRVDSCTIAPIPLEVVGELHYSRCPVLVKIRGSRD